MEVKLTRLNARLTFTYDLEGIHAPMYLQQGVPQQIDRLFVWLEAWWRAGQNGELRINLCRSQNEPKKSA